MCEYWLTPIYHENGDLNSLQEMMSSSKLYNILQKYLPYIHMTVWLSNDFKICKGYDYKSD